MRRRSWALGGAMAALMLFAVACSAMDEKSASISSPSMPMQGRTESAIGNDSSVPSSAPYDAGKAGDSSGSTQNGGATSPQPASGGPAGSTIERKIIHNATLSLQVNDVSAAFDQVSNLAGANGGFVATSRFTNDSSGAQVSNLTLKIPANRYDAVLSDLRRMSVKVESEQNGSNDVTEEYTDLQSRLRNLEATEAQYLELMKSTKSINEVLSVQDRLNTVRGEIERTKGRISLLDRLSDLATITVTLRPVAAGQNMDGPKNLLKAASDAWQASIVVLQVLAIALVSAVAFGWWLLPLVALAIYLIRRNRPRAKAPAQEAPTA